MPKKDQNTLILGIGNEILMDDGIGPILTRRFEKELPYRNVSFDTAFMGGLDILEFIQGYEKVIFIDAIKTRNGIPGDVYFFTPEDFKETLHLSNLHDVSFLTALKLGEELSFKIPESIMIIAIEIIEDTIFGNEFTPPLKAKYEEIYQEIHRFLKSIIQEEITVENNT